MNDPRIEQNIFGSVVWWNDERGFGFARREDTLDDVFLHYKNIKTTDVRRTLKEKQRIIFNVRHDPKGQCATDILPVVDLNLVQALFNVERGEDGNILSRKESHGDIGISEVPTSVS